MVEKDKWEVGKWYVFDNDPSLMSLHTYEVIGGPYDTEEEAFGVADRIQIGAWFGQWDGEEWVGGKKTWEMRY